jgi:hypothetical protein
MRKVLQLVKNYTQYAKPTNALLQESSVKLTLFRTIVLGKM